MREGWREGVLCVTMAVPLQVMFTGVIDQEGEETVKELGGEMVDSVYHCTHLITDKVHTHAIPPFSYLDSLN